MNFSEWFKTMLAGLVGTAIGIVITFGTQNVLEKRQKRQAAEVSAKMVLSNVEAYILNMEEQVSSIREADSLFHYLGEVDADFEGMVLDSAGRSCLLKIFQIMGSPGFLGIRDETAERIFSSNFAIWENLSTPEFISVMGQSFDLVAKIENASQNIDKERDAVYRKYYLEGYDEWETAEELAWMILESADFYYFVDLYEFYSGLMQMALPLLKEQNEYCMELMEISREDLMEFLPASKSAIVLKYN